MSGGRRGGGEALLVALAETGALAVEERRVCSCGSVRGGAWRPHFRDHDDHHVITKERRYVTEWKQADA